MSRGERGEILKVGRKARSRRSPPARCITCCHMLCSLTWLSQLIADGEKEVFWRSCATRLLQRSTQDLAPFLAVARHKWQIDLRMSTSSIAAMSSLADPTSQNLRCGLREMDTSMRVFAFLSSNSCAPVDFFSFLTMQAVGAAYSVLPTARSILSSLS